MLVLKRNVREAITITDRRTGETITVTVAECKGYVRLGIEASDDYRIVRSELLTKPVLATQPSK